ncbi:hypothetical protein Bca4012_009921 [Brassica carinata]
MGILPSSSSVGILGHLLVRDGAIWSLPHACSERQLQLHAYVTTLYMVEASDIPVWSVSGSVHKSFVSKAVWNEVRPRKQAVSWASLVWDKAIIPRHATTAWLFLLNRNPTLDRIHSWDAESLTTCLLCGMANESRDHLFFECQFSLQVWLIIINRLLLPSAPSTWSVILPWLPHAHGDSFRRLALIQGWQAALYCLWQERNARMHAGLTLSPAVVARRAVVALKFFV